MNGIDRDELNGGVSAPSVDASTPAQYHTLLQSKYGPRLGSQVEVLYPVSRFPNAYIAWRTVNADADSVCPIADRRPQYRPPHPAVRVAGRRRG